VEPRRVSGCRVRSRPDPLLVASAFLCVLLLSVLMMCFIAAQSRAATAAAAGSARQLRMTVLESPYGYTQSPFMRPASTTANAKSLAQGLDSLDTLPASYDLRSLDRVSAIRNQNPYGTCWSFAAMASLESGLLSSLPYDFSEDNMVLNSGYGFADPYNNGGNDYMATAYLTRWAGPVTEAQDAYGDGITPPGLTPGRHVQEVRWIPAASGTSNDALKQAVMDTGAVSVSIYWSSTYYNSAHTAFYMPSGASSRTNHAVAIIGWDDAYPASNFNSTPAGDGAWLVRNSWGTGWGSSGYFWVSYYDGLIGAEPWAYVNAEAASNYDNVYQYDTLGLVDCFGYGGQTAWGANHFVADSGEQLAAVSFWTMKPGSSYEVWYGSNLSSPDLTNMTRLASGTETYAGYHTVSLAGGPVVANGQHYVIAVKFTTPGWTYPIPIEMWYSGYSEQSTGSPGESFISSGGSTWTDFDSTGLEGNVCLKAFTNETSAPPTEDPDDPTIPPVGDTTPPLTTDDADADWYNEEVLVTLEADDGETGAGVARTEYSVDGGAWVVAEDAGLAEVTVAAPADHSGDGVHTISYRSVDEAGNVEPTRTCSVKIDTRRPTTAVSRKVLVRRNRTAAVRYVAKDQAPSGGSVKATIVVKRKDGVVVLRYRVRGWVTTGTAHTARFTCKLPRGKYTVRAGAVDAAGNKSTNTASRRFIVR